MRSVLYNISFLYDLVVTKAFVASGCIARQNEFLVVINDILNFHKFSRVYRNNHAQVLLGRSSSRNKQKKRETTRNYFSIVYYLHLECYQGCIRLIPHKSVSIKIHRSYLCGKNIYICYLPAGRSVLGKTVPEVLRTCSRPRAQFFPIRTDLGRQIMCLFFSLWKITL